MVVSSLFVVEDDKKFIDRGGTIRFTTYIIYPRVEAIQQYLDIGMEVNILTNTWSYRSVFGIEKLV